MRVTPLALAFFLCAAIASGCGDDDRPASDTSTGTDTARPDTAMDTAPPMMDCTSDTECDDGHECTLDVCVAGGTCRYTALDSRCADGERCAVGEGCVANLCDTDEDCQDGNFCNGEEKCIVGAGCFAASAPADCDDGNECTADSCDPGLDGCRYEMLCDTGTPVTDSGPMAVPFDATMHYTGTFLVAPAPSLGCPPASYGVGELNFDVEGDTLVVLAARFRLTQTPVPTSGTFSVSTTSDAHCSSVSLMGAFSDSNNLRADWFANCSGSGLGGCGTQSMSVAGARR